MIQSEIKKKYLKIITILFIVIFIYWFFCLPKVYFEVTTSSIIESRKGELLSARIAKDGQWRFPLLDSVPNKFKHCIIQFEDRTFESHLGISIRSLARAVYQNLSQKKVVSG